MVIYFSDLGHWHCVVVFVRKRIVPYWLHSIDLLCIQQLYYFRALKIEWTTLVLDDYTGFVLCVLHWILCYIKICLNYTSCFNEMYEEGNPYYEIEWVEQRVEGRVWFKPLIGDQYCFCIIIWMQHHSCVVSKLFCEKIQLLIKWL